MTAFFSVNKFFGQFSRLAINYLKKNSPGHSGNIILVNSFKKNGCLVKWFSGEFIFGKIDIWKISFQGNGFWGKQFSVKWIFGGFD